MAAEKLVAEHSKIADLVTVRTVLEELIHQCDAHPDASRSPIVSALCAASHPS